MLIPTHPKSSIAGPNIVEVIEWLSPNTACPTSTRGSTDLKKPVNV